MRNKPNEIISITNLKGGVGKTTFCFHLGYLFSTSGRKTLLIDIDPQGNLTSCFFDGIPEEKSHVKLLFEGKKPEPVKVRDNLHIIPSDIELSRYELQIKLETYFKLRNFLESPEIKEKYDIILIDTPPSLNIFTSNALIASSLVLCVIDQGKFSFSGYKEVKSLIETLSREMNLSIKLTGPVFNMVKERTVIFREMREQYREMCGNELFENFVRYSVNVKKALKNRKTVFECCPGHKVAEDFKKVYAELLERIEKKR